MKKLFFSCLALVVAIGSASAQSRTERVDYQESSARNLEPQQSVMISPMIADMEVVADKIYYTETEAFRNYPLTEALIPFVPEFKKVALSRAARAYKADVIVGATVDVITNGQGYLEITISGYPARYTRFRNATSEDIDLVAQADRVMGDSEEILQNPDTQTRVTIEK